MNERTAIDEFLSAGPWAVVGAARSRAKYGNKVLRSYQRAGKAPLYAVNPNADEVEGLPAYPSLGALPEVPRAVSIITPPDVTDEVVDAAIGLGIRHLWLQPGAESPAAVARAEGEGVSVIHSGPCLLVVLGAP